MKLFWDNHFGYVPPPSDPYPPRSPPQLAVYRASGTPADGSSDAGLVAGGRIGAGPRADDSSFWITPLYGYFGCANGSQPPCLLTIRPEFGDPSKDSNISQQFVIPPCGVGFFDCELIYMQFDHRFVGLKSISITASVDERAVDYYMDDLRLDWYNKSASAQLVRASSE